MTDAPYEIPAEPARPVLPPENVGRGLLFSLAVIPVGIVIWTLISMTGFITSLVAFAVSAGAVWLYRKGSGGRVSFKGVIVIAAITLVTLVLALLAGFAWNEAAGLAEGSDVSTLELLSTPFFWAVFGEYLPEILGLNILNILLALVFGVLGAFSVLRAVFKEAAAAPAQSFDFPITDQNAAFPTTAAPAPAPGTPAIPPVPTAEAPTQGAPDTEPKA